MQNHEEPNEPELTRLTETRNAVNILRATFIRSIAFTKVNSYLDFIYIEQYI